MLPCSPPKLHDALNRPPGRDRPERAIQPGSEGVEFLYLTSKIICSTVHLDQSSTAQDKAKLRHATSEVGSAWVSTARSGYRVKLHSSRHRRENADLASCCRQSIKMWVVMGPCPQRPADYRLKSCRDTALRSEKRLNVCRIESIC